jgi:hypothetical protein
LPGELDPSGAEDPITAAVPNQKKRHKKSDIWIIVIVSGSSLGLLLICAVILFLLVKWKKLGRLHDAMSSETTPAANRRYGMVLNHILVCSFVLRLFMLCQLSIAYGYLENM